MQYSHGSLGVVRPRKEEMALAIGSALRFGVACLRLLLATHQRCDLRLAAPSPSVRRLLDIIGTYTPLRVYPSLDAARTLQPRDGGVGPGPRSCRS